MTENNFNIRDFGASPNVEDVQTRVFQETIDKCRDAGGGTVVIPKGEYVIGSIRLYSNIHVLLKAGAIIKGSKNLEDYITFGKEPDIRYSHDDYFIKAWNLPPYYFYALITAYDARNVSIEGESGSIIDGRDVFDQNGEEKFRGPMGLVFGRVNNLELSGYTIKNSSNWSHVIANCKRVEINKVSILGGHDGFNLHHSEEIDVENCILKTGDDCFAGYDVHGLRVNNCWINTACNGMRIGGNNLEFDHCMFSGPGEYPHLSKKTNYTHTIFKYYAINADEILQDGQNIVIKNSIIHGSRKLVTYNFGEKDIMQDGKPLRKLRFEGDVIDGLDEMSEFYGNGQKVQLDFVDCKITPPADMAFLKIDDSVNLNLKNVYFKKTTNLFYEDGKMKNFVGLIGKYSIN